MILESEMYQDMASEELYEQPDNNGYQLWSCTLREPHKALNKNLLVPSPHSPHPKKKKKEISLSLIRVRN